MGALVGALLLLILPEAVFGRVVPILIALGVFMVALAPRLHSRLRYRSPRHGNGFTARPALHLTIFAVSVYGGYFGAAQGVLFIGFMSLFLPESLQTVNAVKNVLATIVNAVAAGAFIVLAPSQVDWAVVFLIGAGAFLGGYVGGRVGRRLRPGLLKAIVVLVGLAAIARFLFN
jgi:uncharacterized membrane protein YfcA